MGKNLKRIFITSASLLMLASVGAGMSTTNASAERIYEHVAAKSVHSNRGLWLRYGSKVHIKGLLPGAYKVTIPGHRGEWIIPDLHDGAKQSKSYIKSLRFGHHRHYVRKHTKKHVRKHLRKHIRRHHARRHSHRNHYRR